MYQQKPEIRILEVGPDVKEALIGFFQLLKLHGIDHFFKPHPLDEKAAHERAYYSGQDYYCVMSNGKEILGYGMLRGWDEGFEIPSLGIVIHPQVQRQGSGRLLMNHLHKEAQNRGAKRVRLRVNPDNTAAVNLYRKLGYDFTAEKDSPYLLGYLNLEQ